MSMDAIEFVKQLRRMDEKGVLKHRFIYPITSGATDPPEEVVGEVEEWAKMNPIKTRQSVFLEQYPEAQIDNNGVLGVCPAPMFRSYRTDGGGCIDLDRKCPDCRREFWGQVVE